MLSPAYPLVSSPIPYLTVRPAVPAQKYVIFRGLGESNLRGAMMEANLLVGTGIAPQDIIIHQCPFPEPFPSLIRPWLNLKNIWDYIRIANPFSQFSKQEYQKLK